MPLSKAATCCSTAIDLEALFEPEPQRRQLAEYPIPAAA